MSIEFKKERIKHLEKSLIDLEDKIRERISVDIESYQHNNRRVDKTPLETLVKIRKEYRIELKKLKKEVSGKKGPSVIEYRNC